MILSKIIEHLYVKIYIGIVVSSAHCNAVVEMYKGKKLDQRLTKSFDGDDAQEKMREVIEEYTAESPLHYIAFLCTCSEQGALSGRVKQSELVDLSTAHTLQMGDKWTVYVSKPQLDALENRYSRIGLDYLFSPFVVLSRFFTDKLQSANTLFVLIDPDAISTMVFDNGVLKYGSYQQLASAVFKSAEDASEDEPLEDDFSGAISLDDMDALDELEGIDDFDVIEGLDDIEGLSDFEDMDDVAKMDSFAAESESDSFEMEGPEGGNEKMSMESFNKDYQYFNIISSMLQEYYTDERYDNNFIETTYIADGVGVSDDLKRYLEEELFLNVYIRKIDLAFEIVELAREEESHAV